MHPYISQGIAAERRRDMQARAAQGRRARQAHNAAKAHRRVFAATRLWARPSGRVATPVTRVPAVRSRQGEHVGEVPAGNQEHRGRAA